MGLDVSGSSGSCWKVLVIVLFFAVILHSFFSFFLRTLSIALIVFFAIFLLSTFSHCYRFTTLTTSCLYPFIVIFYLILHSLSLIRNKDKIDFI